MRDIDSLRDTYPKGTKVRLISMDDEYAPLPGTIGTVMGVDDAGQIMVSWDRDQNGRKSSLSLIPDHDEFEKL